MGFIDELKSRIIVLDGAMGTMIQSQNLSEEDYRKGIDFEVDINQKGNSDIVSVSRPDVIKDIHLEYLNAGCDVIKTNTFTANISQREYGLEKIIYDINLKSTKIAKEAVEVFYNITKKKCYVAGSVGPSSKTLSISPDVTNPTHRDVTFDEMKDIYKEQIRGLVDGGADVILVETIFDVLVGRTAILAIEEVFIEKHVKLPVMISGTIIDNSGRILSGHTIESFVHSLDNETVISYGLNCSFGAKDLLPYIRKISKITKKLVSIHPNAGLPNSLGKYDETPEQTANYIGELAEEGIVNIVGGCCGTTPEHIKCISKKVKNYKPRIIPEISKKSVYCGLETIYASEEINFINIGERNNVAGSKKFARLISEKKYEEAINISRNQVENGAQLLDINFDDAMLDGKKEMEHFLKLISSEPEIAKVPIMIDSSKWEVIEAGLKSIGGKHIVNSISLKEGEEEFIKKARYIKKFGAALVVMAFDENGQADTYEKRIDVCKRAYDILLKEVGFNSEDVIFDPNVLSIATGIEEHDNYAVDFINTVKWIKENLPGAKVSGGISNLSFAFRGNNVIREAMHSVFLYHAINNGLDMGIINPGMIQIYDDIPKDFLELVEDVVLNKNKDAKNKLLDYASSMKNVDKTEKENKNKWRELDVRERLVHAVLRGITEFIKEDIIEAHKEIGSALGVIEDVLMVGMNKVGDLFGDGKMFLPQVIKSARVMKMAVEILKPHIEDENQKENSSKQGKILIATVKGDVHDIGKNIVALVLACNNFEVIDKGIMVPAEDIIEEAEKIDADIIGVSGLITPSLDEMVYIAGQMKARNMEKPLIIGGATTSKIHTALKIAPEYDYNVVYVKDASKSVEVCKNLIKDRKEYMNRIKDDYIETANNFQNIKREFLSIEEARKNNRKMDFSKIVEPGFKGIKYFINYPIDELFEYIDWTFFFTAYEMNKKFPDILSDSKYKEEANKLYKEAKDMLLEIYRGKLLKANGVFGIFSAVSEKDDIILYTSENKNREIVRFNMLRNQEKSKNKENVSLADFVAPEDSDHNDYVGVFIVTTGIGVDELVKKYEKENDFHKSIMIKVLADRLAEAFAEKLHEMVRSDYWGYEKNKKYSNSELIQQKYIGIRPAIGYPSIPDHSEKLKLQDLFDFENRLGIKLTENYMMYPGASVCGLYFGHPEAGYFDVGKIKADQMEDYAKRKRISIEEANKLLSSRII